VSIAPRPLALRPLALGLLLGGVGLLCAAVPAWGPPAASADEPAAPAAKPIDAAIARGVEYLLATQKKSGCWGSPASNLFDIYAPAPGSQRSFEVGASALALSALVEVGGEDARVAAAIERATRYLLQRPVVRRIRPNTLYNTWAIMYALEAFARLLGREQPAEREKALRDAARQCVQALQRYEFVEGGWGYYNFGEKTRDPGPGSTSFTTASGLVALGMAKQRGVKVPRKLVQRAVEIMQKCRRPDGAYAYSYRTSWWATAGINKTKGSLARTPACLMALRLSEAEVDAAAFVQALEELETYGHFLRIARKYPVPHETWYQNSGYFCFYGYYYAGLCLDHVPPKRRKTFAAQIAGHLVKLQEKDGSWWDYQLYGYHKAYGTGYVLLTLGACRK
jgi:hypothetical protein